MPDNVGEKAVEKIKDIAQQTAKSESSAPASQWYRTVLFRVALFSVIGALAILTSLVATTPSFPIDLQITLAIQLIDSPFFEGLMRLVSWPGFASVCCYYLAYCVHTLCIWAALGVCHILTGRARFRSDQ